MYVVYTHKPSLLKGFRECVTSSKNIIQYIIITSVNLPCIIELCNMYNIQGLKVDTTTGYTVSIVAF